MAETTPEVEDNLPEWTESEERWMDVQDQIHAAVSERTPDSDDRLILMNAEISAAADILDTHDIALGKIIELFLSMQKRNYVDRKAQQEKIRDLQLKIVEMKKLRPADKKTQDGIITRNYFEKMVVIEEEHHDVNFLKGSLRIINQELQKKAQRFRAFPAQFEGDDEKDPVVQSAKDFVKKVTRVSTESKEMEESKKDLRSLWDAVEKKKMKKEAESETHKEIFSVIETLDLLSDTPVYFRNMPEEAKKLVESYKIKENPSKRIAGDEIEKIESYTKRLELGTEILKDQHKQSFDRLKDGFMKDIDDVKEKFENYRKKYEEEAMKVREKDREILELKSVRDSVLKKLVKASKTNKRVEGMVFLNENIKHVYNSIEYKDGIVASLEHSLRLSEQARVADMMTFLAWQRDFRLSYLQKYEPNNSELKKHIMDEYTARSLETRPFQERLITHKIQMDEYRRNEIWLNQTRKCMEINEDHLKKFIAEVPKNVNRLKYGRIEPDSIEAQMFDVQAWAKECLRFKGLNEILLAQRKKLDTDLSNLSLNYLAIKVENDNLRYRVSTQDRIVEQNMKVSEMENSKIIQWFLLSLYNSDAVIRHVLPEMQKILTAQAEAANAAPEASTENGKDSEATEQNGVKENGEEAPATTSEDPTEAPPTVDTSAAFQPQSNMMRYVRDLYHTEYASLLTVVASEASYMRERRKAGLPMIDPDRLENLAIALEQHRRVKAEVCQKMMGDLNLRSHRAFLVNPDKWNLNETVEKQMIGEMHHRIIQLEGKILVLSRKLEEKEKEVVEKTNHVRIVEGVYLRCRYGTERVQIPARKKQEP